MSDIEDKIKDILFWKIISLKGDELDHALLLNINKKSSSDLSLHDIEKWFKVTDIPSPYISESTCSIIKVNNTIV